MFKDSKLTHCRIEILIIDKMMHQRIFFPSGLYETVDDGKYLQSTLLYSENVSTTFYMLYNRYLTCVQNGA